MEEVFYSIIIDFIKPPTFSPLLPGSPLSPSGPLTP